MTTAPSPAKTEGVVVKGLAKRMGCPRHESWGLKCVDAGLSGNKSGYSPVTGAILLDEGIPEATTQARARRLSQRISAPSTGNFS